MVALPKKYTRLVQYLGVVTLLVVGLFYFNLHGNITLLLKNGEGGVLSHYSRDPEAPLNGIVVNFGLQRCYHLASWVRICPFKESTLNIGSGDVHISNIKRVVVNKDLLGSEHYNWFGSSEFIWYDVFEIKSVTDVKNMPTGIRLKGLTSIRSNSKGICDHPLRNMCIEAHNLDESSLENVRFISKLTVLFGEDATDPRPNWNLNKDMPLSNVRFPSYISETYWDNNGPKTLSLSSDSSTTQDLVLNYKQKFKIVQFADLHFSVGVGRCRDEFPKHDVCEADPKTLKFMDSVLDIEDPQMVVFTGDQIMGDECKQDSESALLKVLAPVIARKIPWAIVWGNHDDEGSMSRWQLSKIVSELPYSLFQIGPSDTDDNTFGVGNYVREIKDNKGKTVTTLYFLDSHKCSQNSKVFPGYDWIKEEQWKYMEEYANTHDSIKQPLDSKQLLSMAFFHIPIPEYREFPSEYSNRMVGTFKEGITAPKYNSHGIETLHKLGVSVTSCGHDHCNDFCVLNEKENNRVWLCYGGGTGEGGYAGYGGTERRARIFEIDAQKKNIYSWKRLNGSPEKTFGHQKLVSGGAPYIA